MAKAGISTGTTPNDGNGDTLLSGAIKINQNFTEVYNILGNGTNLNTIGIGGTIINVTATANVGIGTTIPSQKLEIGGSTYTAIDIKTTGGIRSRIVSNDSGSSLDVATISSHNINFYTNNVYRSRFDTSGNLLIGTATSTGTLSQPLQVNGGAYVSGNIGIGTTNPNFPIASSGVHISGALNVQSVAPLIFLTETDNANNYYNLVVDAGTFGVRYNNNYPGPLQVNSSSVLVGTATSTGTASQRLQVFGGAYVSDKLGIGVTNPSVTLTLRTTHSPAAPTTYTGAFLIHDEPNNVQPHLGAGVAYASGLQHSWIQSNSSSGVYPLCLQPVGGNVGVGSINPISKLHVEGGVYINGKLDISNTSPAAWGGGNAIDVSLYSAYAQRSSGTCDLSITWNSYIDSGNSSGTGYKYKRTGDIASAYEQNGGHRWYVTPTAGTAGNTISFTQAMTLTSGGNLLINSATSTGTIGQPLQVTGGAYVSGNIGIGVANPSVKLDCAPYSASTVNTVLARGTDINFQLSAQNGPNINASGQEVFRFGNNYSGTGWNTYLQFIRGGGAQDGSLAIFTSNTERIRIDSSGKVGIGSTIPSQNLDVVGGNGFVRIGGIYPGYNGITFNNSTASTDYNIISNPGDTNLYINRPTGAAIRFRMNNIDQMILDSSGNIGIGTINPTSKVHANGSILSTGTVAGIGYTTGSGGSVTQSTSKTTSVTLDASTGVIVTSNSTINAGITSSFTFTNPRVQANDLLLVEHISGGSLASYTIAATPSTGSAIIYIRNNSSSNLAEALTLRFAIIKSTNS